MTRSACLRRWRGLNIRQQDRCGVSRIMVPNRAVGVADYVLSNPGNLHHIEKIRAGPCPKLTDIHIMTCDTHAG
jgi:hypothetical protein